MTYATVEIMGGLGNQLFQIFTLIAYCFQHKTAFYFSDKPIQHGQRKKTYWSTLLKTLEPFTRGVSTPRTPPGGKPPTPPIGGKVEEQTNEAPNEAINPHGGAWGVQPPKGARGVLTPLPEQNFHYQALPPPPENQDVALFGYFQSYKYFEDHQCDIFRILKVRDSQAKVRAQHPYNYAKTLAVHFRVGDYVALPNHHPLMTLEYYTQALKRFLKDMPEQQENKSLTTSGRESALCETMEQAQQHLEQAQQHLEQAEQACTWNILYFCEQNDQAFVDTHFIQPLQQHPELMGKFSFQCIDHNLEDWTQMLVMSLCKHHIIANSTFSWWGAFLANDSSTNANDSSTNANDSSSSSTKVYYPRTWFGPAMGNKNMADLFPPEWRKINV